MGKIGRGLLLLWAAGLWAVALAAVGALQLVVDQNEVSEGESLSLEVRLENVNGAGDPEVPGLEAFEVTPAGVSNQIQIINGATTRSTVHRYQLVPKGPGRFELGPARIRAEGQELSSQKVTVVVKKGASAPKADSPFRVTAELSAGEVFLNETVRYRFRFYARDGLMGANLSLPEFQGFLKEEKGGQREFEELVNGVRWRVTEIEVALTPTREGTLEIPPAVLTGQMRGAGRRRGHPLDEFFDSPFFGGGAEMKPVRLATSVLALKVRPLPEIGKPKGFHGIVGEVKVQSSLSRDQVEVGESTTWTVEVSGKGNIRDVTLAPDAPKGFRLYDDEPVFSPPREGQPARKVFKRALVAVEPGEHRLEPARVDYFNPESRKYEVAAGTPHTVTVTGTAAQVAALPGGGSGKETLIPPNFAQPPRRDALSSGDRRLAALLVGLSWLGVALFALVGALKRRGGRRGPNPVALYRRRLALEREPHWDALSEGVQIYLGARFPEEGHALTSAEVRSRLGRRLGVRTVEELEAILKELEAARYGGGGDSPTVLKDRLDRWVAQAEREVRG